MAQQPHLCLSTASRPPGSLLRLLLLVTPLLAVLPSVDLVDAVDARWPPSDLVKCLPAKSKETRKKKRPCRSVLSISRALFRRSGTSSSTVIWRETKRARRTQAHRLPSHRSKNKSDADERVRLAAAAAAAQEEETPVEGDEAPRRRRPPRALSSLLHLSASDPPSALPPVTAPKAQAQGQTAHGNTQDTPAAASKPVEWPSAVESRLSQWLPDG
ncbi:hypothetical protein MGYG_06341 [Nannizzia gypsea CBS 118893]|uniref:Uncharacterized protein n=1 Tax=Arthroderma gypseum (strain ATCC MYA-4604 / CBS 118893) TaxID=535722 RepID=E4UZ15_ARTGP|nr:hypothetical protein MGYG_06341 [Nannizzia gypsea CBS 118893]EFR03345.1 hypothetical protein MGYG_06341 [Nannizzia gypsea CBS 118893]